MLVPAIGHNDTVDELTALALAAGAGDRVALASFVRHTQADVWRFCAHVNGRREADDLTQETYLRAIPALARFEGRSSAKSWLLSIARRTCVDSVRRAVRRRRLGEQLASESVPEAHPSSSGAVDLMLLLAGLDDDRRQAFVLTQVLGLSYAETAEACGCPVGTIRSRVARAREDLVRRLGQAEFG
jgi:RNA polymerase sigma-70 factor, ECF subfamily